MLGNNSYTDADSLAWTSTFCYSDGSQDFTFQIKCTSDTPFIIHNLQFAAGNRVSYKPNFKSATRIFECGWCFFQKLPITMLCIYSIKSLRLPALFPSTASQLRYSAYSSSDFAKTSKARISFSVGASPLSEYP